MSSINYELRELRNNKLQELCRGYLAKMRYMATKHGLLAWLDNMIDANKRKECVATEKEVLMLSRLCDDERLHRADIPRLLGKSYRESFANDDFDKVKRLRYVGIYSKVDAILYSVVDEHRRKVKDLKERRRRYIKKLTTYDTMTRRIPHRPRHR